MKVYLGPPGKPSCWNPNTGDVLIDPLLLLNKDISICRFVICHEGVHCRLSRPDLFPESVYRDIGFPLFYNFMEDPRINNFQSQRDSEFVKGQHMYYGEQLASNDSLEAAVKASKLQEIPRYLLASRELMKIWFQKLDTGTYTIDKDLPDTVQEAVRNALPGAETYWKIYPTKIAAMDKSEVERYALGAHKVLTEQVWPHIQELVELDIEDEIAKQFDDYSGGEDDLSGEHELREELVRMLFADLDKAFDNAKPVDKSQQKYRFVDTDCIESNIDNIHQEELRRQAEEALEDYESGDCIVLPSYFLPSPVEVEEDLLVEDGLLHYMTVAEELWPLIDPLYLELQSEFFKRQKGERKTGLTEGVELDFDKFLDEKAQDIPAWESEAWCDYTAPSILDYGVVIGVDCSGSMRGNKIHNALKGLILWSEVLFKLGVKYEAFIFHEEFKVLKSFNEPFNDEIRSKIGLIENETLKEAASYNNDGYALWTASERLEKLHVSERRLFMISDGLPVPDFRHRGPEWDLNHIVNKIMTETNQLLLGLGIGPGTQHVKDFYPYSLANIEIEQFVKQIAPLMRKFLIDIPVYRRGMKK